MVRTMFGERNCALEDCWDDEDDIPRHEDDITRNIWYDTAQMSMSLAEAHLKSDSIKMKGDKRITKILECMSRAKKDAGDFHKPWYFEFEEHRQETIEMYNTLVFRLNRKLGYPRLDYVLD